MTTMAKKDTKPAKAEKPEPKEEKATEREFKFGVEDLAEMMDIKPASVRVQLRNHGIEKAGKSYGWNSKTELKEVVAQLKASKDDEDEKPAKGKKDEKPAKKGAKAGSKSKKPAAEDD